MLRAKWNIGQCVHCLGIVVLSKLWWSGPDWMQSEKSKWPNTIVRIEKK